MYNVHNTPRAKPHPLKMVVGIVGIIFGIMFFLQMSNAIQLSFDMTNPVYLKIFAVYAIIAGITITFTTQQHGIIRY